MCRPAVFRECPRRLLSPDFLSIDHGLHALKLGLSITVALYQEPKLGLNNNSSVLPAQISKTTFNNSKYARRPIYCDHNRESVLCCNSASPAVSSLYYITAMRRFYEAVKPIIIESDDNKIRGKVSYRRKRSRVMGICSAQRKKNSL